MVQRCRTDRQQRLEEVVIPDFNHVQRGEIQRIKDAEGNGSSDMECSDEGEEDGVCCILADDRFVKGPGDEWGIVNDDRAPNET